MNDVNWGWRIKEEGRKRKRRKKRKKPLNGK
jgi:hypothetical protein